MLERTEPAVGCRRSGFVNFHGVVIALIGEMGWGFCLAWHQPCNYVINNRLSCCQGSQPIESNSLWWEGLTAL
eukprot:1161723-Pelagomonas_calceolata.AAC.7